MQRFYHLITRMSSHLRADWYDPNSGAQAAKGGYNYIRGISPTNPNGPGYMRAAYNFLEQLSNNSGGG